MVRIRGKFGLCSFTLYRTPWKPQIAKCIIPTLPEIKLLICWRKKMNCNSFQGKTATEPFRNNQKALMKTPETWGSFPNKVLVRKWCWESYKSETYSNRKMTISTAKVNHLFYKKRYFSHCLAILLNWFFTYL